MTPRWDADITVSIEDARAAIDAQFEALAPASLVKVGEGWDNVVFRVNDRWVFRFPRREVAVGLMDAERVALPAIAPHVPLPVPDPAFVGTPSARFPRPFLGYRWIEGITADRRMLDDGARARLAPSIGAFLRALHAIPITQVRGVRADDTDAAHTGLPCDTIRRLDVAHRRPACLERLERLLGQGAIACTEPWRSIAHDTPDGWTPGATAIVHGDLDPRHVLLDGTGAPMGIIDWGDVHAGDPACDLAIAYTLVPGRHRNAFFDAYGNVDEDRRRMARFRALYGSVNLLEYAIATKDKALVREATAWLAHVAE